MSDVVYRRKVQKYFAVPTTPANAAFLAGYGFDIEKIGGHYIVVFHSDGEPTEVITTAQFHEWYEPDD